MYVVLLYVVFILPVLNSAKYEFVCASVFIYLNPCVSPDISKAVLGSITCHTVIRLQSGSRDNSSIY